MKGRSIVDNVLLCHELVRGYGMKNHSSRMLIKADLRKAYDSIKWKFLRSCLPEMGFPTRFLSWIILCVESHWFSVVINGNL